MIRELIEMGYENVRFYSYERINFKLVVVLYQEMPFKARTGQSLIYPDKLLTKIFRRDLTPKVFTEIDEWAEQGISPYESASLFAAQYLSNDIPSLGCCSEEYFIWLNQIIELCPDGSFPITEEFIPGGACPPSDATTFYGSEYLTPFHLEHPLPPGLRGAIDPYTTFLSDIAERTRREEVKARGPSGFALFNQKFQRGT